jgi:hypothetical protein
MLLSVLCAGPSNHVWSADQPAQEKAKERLDPPKMFRAGASSVDVSPKRFPVLINGGFLQSQATKITDPVRARSLVLDDGSTRLAIVVVDTCMMPRELIDRAKELARERTGIRSDRMLISATHTHSAPAAMGALGCPADENYVRILPGLIADSITKAAGNLEPARIGWSSIENHEHTFCRRFIRRPDKMLDDPFGERTVRANMHPGYQSPDVIGPSGPVDPELIVLSVQSQSGRPIAVLANYSMHYYGAEPVSADYYGRFTAALATRLKAQAALPPFVGIMSQGTSGDQMWMNYDGPKKDPGLDTYARDVARVAHQAYQSIAYHDWVPLAMAETKLTLARRTPDPKRLAWATEIVDRMRAQARSTGKPAVPQSQAQVYAQEAIYLQEAPQRELKLQAIRIGGMGITAIPNEVFAITGLKLKMRSPFETTMNIELANGSEGYIPPPEQHRLGGYTTWPARTAGLEVEAEPQIVARVLAMLEQLAGKPLRGSSAHHGSYAQSILASRPLAYWRLDDIDALAANDSTGNGRHASYEGGVALYLPGNSAAGFSAGKSINRAIHFAGGRLRARLDGVGENYTVELWFWNGLPTDIRPITGHLIAFEFEGAIGPTGGHVGLGGTRMAWGRLFFSSDDSATRSLVGKTEITNKTWHHLGLVRDRGRITIYLDGKDSPEIFGEVAADPKRALKSVLVGGSGNNLTSFEGKIDEIAVYDRALDSLEIARHFAASAAAKPSLPQPRD